MRLIRYAVAALAGLLLWATTLQGQGTTGTITGQVTDVGTQQGLSGVLIRVLGTQLSTQTRSDGGYTLTEVPTGAQRLRVTRIGYAPVEQAINVTADASTPANVAMQPQAAMLAPLVVTGYGSQRREAVTGSVATIDPNTANVGVTTNVNQMLQGRTAGVSITTNNGEPGSGVQIRIRGASSINASNEPLYVIDGVPITNAETEAPGYTLGNTPALPRSPLNLLNPSDIGSITILKDASATAIYGSRGANGVILIETKRGASGGASMTYDSYVATATPYRSLDVLNGDEYRQFVQGQVAIYNVDTTIVGPDTTITTTGLPPSYAAALGTANTDWAKAVRRNGLTHNHNLSFAGGGDVTRYRAALNFMNQQGVALSSGLRRVQGRLSANHLALNNRLRLGLNVTTSQVNNDYLANENDGGFEGGVFMNEAIFNPTQPITFTDSLGTHYSEVPPGSVRNPVGLATQIQDFGTTNRTIGNISADLDLVPGLTGRINVGLDKSAGVRQIYVPIASPVGASTSGMARQINRDNLSQTLQAMLTFTRQFGGVHDLDIVGVYEFSQYRIEQFQAEAQGFLTDALGFNGLSTGRVKIDPQSFRTDERWISFIGRASYGFKQKYFLTGVLRRDGRSAFGVDHKWAYFPGVSASWRMTDESFMASLPFSELKFRAGYGVVGNPGVPPYSSLITLEANGGAKYVFGDTANGDATVIGFAPNRNANPDLRFEKTSQIDLAFDYGLMNNRISGTIEYYVKSTSDLLLEVPVPQPAPVERRLENVGKVRNKGFELSLDALAISRPQLTWRAGIVFAMERNKVVNLGNNAFLSTGNVSGQGQSNQISQRIIPGQPLGTFYGPLFVGWTPAGKELFACGTPSASCVSGQTTNPQSSDYQVIGNAYPDFTLGLNSTVTFGKMDLNVQMRGAFGQEVFNNTALVYSTKSNALQGKNFLRDALTDPTDIREPAKFSSRWVEPASYFRVQNITVGYSFNLPGPPGAPRSARVYLSGDNLLLLTGYSGLDPEVHQQVGVASAGIDYLSYPRPRTLTAGVQLAF
jgi:TonB-dependent starch-binding outer membrane protein SusC